MLDSYGTCECDRCNFVGPLYEFYVGDGEYFYMCKECVEKLPYIKGEHNGSN